ncbi:MAG: glycine oxidase [Flavobacteriales bacterium]|jgi:glycine oxidase
MAKKYLIVGQGLAGSVLAQTFISANIQFQIIDDNHKTASSVVAVGIMHPISFKRLILSWRALEFIDAAKSFYQALEKQHTVSLLREMTIYRPLTSADEKSFWLSRMDEDDYKEVLGYEETINLNKIDTPFGVGTVNYGGQLNTNSYLNIITDQLNSGGHLINATFNFEDLKVSEEGVSYGGNEYSDIVFCEGHQMIHNPFFNYLPHNCTQGEVLAIKSADLPLKWISRGCFFLPSEEDENILRVGSTYNWNCIDPTPTKEGKEELLKRIMKLGDINPPTVQEHQAGIRPTTHDRRPYIGTHPEHNNVHIFNGMGSKTVMLAPFLAHHFTDYLQSKATLDQEIDIFRCRKQQFAKFGFYEAKKV